MSLPPLVRWEYDVRFEPGTARGATRRLASAARLARRRLAEGVRGVGYLARTRSTSARMVPERILPYMTQSARNE